MSLGISFYFLDSDHYKSEGSDGVIVAVLSKDSNIRLANPVTFNIHPLTIMEAKRTGAFIPAEALPPAINADPHSPYEAGESTLSIQILTLYSYSI